MKVLDRLLRAWRTRVALAVAPTRLETVLDIGCGEGYLLTRIAARHRIGIDPALTADSDEGGASLRRGMFPVDVDRLGLSGPYDAIFALAVFEHLTDADLAAVRAAVPRLLSPGGRLIITVPHPFVDRILDVLMALRLIEGIAVHEHHGFDPKRLREFASPGLRLERHSGFQFGLNNLFVFEKPASEDELAGRV